MFWTDPYGFSKCWNMLDIIILIIINKFDLNQTFIQHVPITRIDGQTVPTFSPENCWTMSDQNVGSVYLILTLYFRDNIEKKM